VAAVADERNLRAALAYARAGWRVFPAVPGEKVPATAHGVHDATADAGPIRAWWERNPDRNVAIACGHPGPDVLDIDRKPDGSGFPALRQLRQAGLITNPRAMIRTPNDGAHLYYAPTSGSGNGSVPAAHIDHRGAGGYVIAPPSEVRRAADGQLCPYVVVRHQASMDRIDWAAIRQFLDPQPERTWRPPEHLLNGAQQNLDHLPAWLAGQAEGNRNAALFWAANRVLDHGQPERLPELAEAARQAGAGPREIERTVRSALQQARQDPHFRTPREAARLTEPGRRPPPAARREPARGAQRAPVAVLEREHDDRHGEPQDEPQQAASERSGPEPEHQAAPAETPEDAALAARALAEHLGPVERGFGPIDRAKAGQDATAAAGPGREPGEPEHEPGAASEPSREEPGRPFAEPEPEREAGE
jgi:Bifunctional DNA primase/polymerase, N-terminal